MRTREGHRLPHSRYTMYIFHRQAEQTAAARKRRLRMKIFHRRVNASLQNLIEFFVQPVVRLFSHPYRRNVSYFEKNEIFPWMT